METVFFGLRERKKSLEEIFYEMLLTQEIIYHSASTNIIFKENPDQNALFLRVLPWARETIGLSARFCLCIKIFRRILTENAQQYVALQEGFLGDRIGDARIFGAVRAENKSKNLFFAESRQK